MSDDDGPAKITVDGEVDVGWRSYYDPEEHGTPGETVAGTSADDLGELTTEFLPDGLDAADLTDLQCDIVRALVTHPTASRTTIADTVGCSGSAVTKLIQRKGLDVDWADRARRRGDDTVAGRIDSMQSTMRDDDDRVADQLDAVPDRPAIDGGPEIDGDPGLEKALHACAVAERIGGDAAALGAYIRGLLEADSHA